MRLIVGLGNSGKQYEGTRHNIGREVLLEWQKKSPFRPTRNKVGRGRISDFEYDKKLQALISKIPLPSPSPRAGRNLRKEATLLLPETMMNKSGNAVRPALRAFRVKPKDVVVLHDDADIELGRVKLSFGKHSAGHKGVESVKRALGTWDFWRLRIGIQKKKRVDAMKLVLQKFAPAEEAALKKVKKKLYEGLDLIMEEGLEKAMNFVNKN